MSIKLNASPFQIHKPAVADEVSFENFFRWLINQTSGSNWPIHKPFAGNSTYRRELYIQGDDTHIYGLIASTRNNETKHVKTEENGVTIIVATAVGDVPSVDVNFFIIRKDSWKGIYSNYVGSFPFSKFLSDLGLVYRYWVSSKRDLRIAESTPETIDQVKENYSITGTCDACPLFTPRAFRELLGELTSITQLKFTTYETTAVRGVSLPTEIKSVREEYRFVERTSLTNAVLSLIERARTASTKFYGNGRSKHNGVVEGVSATGNVITIDFDNTLENLITMDYDGIGSISTNDLEHHTLVEVLKVEIDERILFNPTGNT